MSSMWCCYSQRPVSPLPNNRPVDLPRPAGTRTPIFRRLTIRKASQGSETRDASKDSGNLRATRQAFETSVSIDATPIETSQTPNLIDVPQPSGRWSRIFTGFTTHNASNDSEVFQAKAKPIKASQITSSVDIPRPVGRHSRIFTRLTTRNTFKDSKDMQAEASPVETSQNTNLVVDAPHPVERRSRIFTRLTARKTSRGSEGLQAEASPVKSFQNTKLVDVPHSIERRSRLFTHLSTRNTSKDSKNLHADATPDQTYQNTDQADAPHPADRRSRIFTRLSTRNTSKGSEDLHTDATPDQTYQNTNLVDVPHSIERRSRLFTRLTTRNTAKGSEDSHTDATPDETYQNTNLVDAPHPADRRSRIFRRLTTQSTSKSGDYTPAEAMPVVTSQNQTKSTMDEDIAPKGGDHTQAEAIPVETSENQTSSTIDEDNVELDMFHLTETQSYTSGHLPTHDTFEGSEDTQATRHISGPTLIIEATPPSLHLYDMRISHSLRSRSLLSSSSLPNLASPYGNHASALASTLSLPSLPSPPASPPPPAASPPPPAAPPSPPAPAAPAPHTPPTSSIYSSTESVGVAPMTLSGDLPPPRRSLDSVWARYPSHDRQGRSLSPAGGREGVAVRDFAPVVVGSPARAVKKARSMGDLLRGCVRRHERQMAKPPGGHRSSIAPGGFVEYPELELVAPATPFAPAAAAPAAPPAAEEEDLSVSPSAPAPQPDLRAPSSEGLAAQFADCVEEDPSEDGEADLARGLHFAELVALRREVNAILAEEMALGLYEGDFY